MVVHPQGLRQSQGERLSTANVKVLQGNKNFHAMRERLLGLAMIQRGQPRRGWLQRHLLGVMRIGPTQLLAAK